jgi:hypothetical protein
MTLALLETSVALVLAFVATSSLEGTLLQLRICPPAKLSAANATIAVVGPGAV